MVEFYVPPVDDLLVSETEDCFTVPVTIVIHRPAPSAILYRARDTAAFVRATASAPFTRLGLAAIFQRPASTTEIRRCS